MRKRILSALLAVMFLFTGLPGTAWAVGEGNMEAGGGQTETVTGDSFWNGDWGIRFCVVDVASQTVVSATYDASNRNSGFEDYHHYGKTNKFDYRNGASLVIQKGLYSWNTPPVSIPTIVRTSGTPDIKAIKDYFTDETVIRWIGDVTGMAYDTLISGDYKLFIEPILYYTFDSQKYAMTATEAALFDRAINGLLLRTMGNATHQQLPLSLYLEKSDLGFSKWSGAKTGIQNDTNIINYLGMGIVSFIPEEEPEPGTGGNGDGPTVPISFRKTDPERFNAANYNTGLITFAPASSNSAAFDNISGAVIEISGNGTGAGTYELPCTVELGEGTFTVREVTPPYQTLSVKGVVLRLRRYRHQLLLGTGSQLVADDVKAVIDPPEIGDIAVIDGEIRECAGNDIGGGKRGDLAGGAVMGFEHKRLIIGDAVFTVVFGPYHIAAI